MNSLQSSQEEDQHLARLDLIALDDDTGIDLASIRSRDQEMGVYNERFGLSKTERVVLALRRIFRI